MEKMDLILEVRNACKKAKEEFLKKKSDEKFDYLYEKLEDLEQEIEDKECEHFCDADENKEEIEKIKQNQKLIEERLDNIPDMEEKISGIIEILKIEEKVKEYVDKKEGERFWKRVLMLTSGKKFTAEEFYSE